MKRRVFSVEALWDEEAKVFYSESDIDGLHIEAKTMKEFEKIMLELAPDLILANHFSQHDSSKVPLADIIPAFSLKIPQGACA